ncbi:unnamed protein product [Alopecurus aequalis]
MATATAYERRLLSAADLVLSADACPQPPRFSSSADLGVTADLKPHQLDGVDWLIRRYHLGVNVMLGDEMGLGKTLQAIALLSYLKIQSIAPGPFLVLCPLSVTDGWLSEFGKFCPTLKVIRYVGDKPHRRNLRRMMHDGVSASASNELPFDVILTSYDITLMDQDFLSQIPWHYVVIDEAQRLKNASSVIWRKAAYMLSQWQISFLRSSTGMSFHCGFASFLKHDFLELRNYTYERLDGSVRAEERFAAIRNFSSQPTKGVARDDINPSGAFVFMISTRAGGVGLNLIGADTVIFYEQDWNPQADKQALQRTHRIGQLNHVLSVNLVSQCTIEEVIMRRAEKKLKLSRNIFGDKDTTEEKRKDLETETTDMRSIIFGLHQFDPADTAAETINEETLAKLESMSENEKICILSAEANCSWSLDAPLWVALAVVQSYSPKRKIPRSEISISDLELCLSKTAFSAAQRSASIRMPRIGRRSGSQRSEWYTIERLLRKYASLHGIDIFVYYYRRSPKQQPDSD